MQIILISAQKNIETAAAGVVYIGKATKLRDVVAASRVYYRTGNARKLIFLQ